MTQVTKNVFLLGATGSIGENTLNVIRRHPDRYNVFGLTGHSNLKLLAELTIEFNPQYVVLTSTDSLSTFKSLLKGHALRTEILEGQDELLSLIVKPEIDVVIAGIVGKAGLEPTLAAARAGQYILLANKESMVMAGPLFRKAILESQARIFPIDSEHNALFQTMSGELQSSSLVTQAACESHGIHQLVLTASGGPFLHTPKEELVNVTPAQACKHPNWAMGAKVSIDSASLMNKGLELIEACYLFGVSQSFVDVVVHPQSIVHSMVTYVDGSTLAHFSNPSMEVPIASGLAYPERHTTGVKPMRWDQMLELQFLPLPYEKFPCFSLARQAMAQAEKGQGATIVLNAANEIAVDAFINGKLGFTQIPNLVEQCLDRFGVTEAHDLADILALDQEVRDAAIDYL